MSNQRDKYDFRLATEADFPFLREMLFEAAYWRTDAEKPQFEVGLARPDVALILEDWGRAGDVAVVACSPEEELLGLAWYRFWTAEVHSYGFVDSETPELGIAVKEWHRRRGIGTGLLEALLVHARDLGIRQMSLSVEQDNPALALYEKLGFQQVSVVSNAWTMAIRLESD